MYPNLRNPQQPQRRRRLAHNASTVLLGIHNSISGSLHAVRLKLDMEFRAQNLLHFEFTVYTILDDESVCADAGTREGVEARCGSVGRECGWSADCDDDI